LAVGKALGCCRSLSFLLCKQDTGPSSPYRRRGGHRRAEEGTV
jgi:hypothetical protein